MRAAKGSLQVGSFRGIPIRVHFTLLLILPVLAFMFGGAFREAARMAEVPPERLLGSPALWGLGVAVGLFASVLVHELAHTVYALWRGGRVRAITLMMVGGVSELTEAPPRPKDEALMALVGPLTSIFLAVVFGGVTVLLQDTRSFNLQFACFYLASLNMFLGVFNLLPAFPMDGGRIVRAALTGRLGPVRATRVASGLGRGMAVLFGLYGALVLNPFLVVIAVFIYAGAEGEARQVRMKATLERVPVSLLMTPGLVGVDVAASLWEAMWALRREKKVVLPVTEGGRPVGWLWLEPVREVPEEERATFTPRELMRPAAVVGVDENAWTALRRMAEHEVPQLAVVAADGTLAGTLDLSDVQRGLALYQERTERNERAARRGWRQERPA
ncbi:site-2 protease family protein [Pyxidicoccus xibeiensis]|uniref:site-2 protease family protein n=1 Tax=Pyxidicoccus xibeiensis TaxID=2906759 RepID=UPI0020A8165A|nr:site-2 protease family protein [Pyxidicoccus xibeiensis]MCP3144267.1 site-2 protease family protein [Pyxidicoccus xibeiensis]